MDSMIFYNPPSVSVNRPFRARMTATTSLTSISAQPLTSTAPIASVNVASDDTSQKRSQRGCWKDHNRIKVANMSGDPVWKRLPLEQPIRIDDLIEKQGNSEGAGNYSNSNSDNDDELPSLEQLPSYIEKQCALARAKQNTSSMGEKVNNRTQNYSPVGCRSSTSSSCQDTIWISDDESDTASQVDNSDSDLLSISKENRNHTFDVDEGPEGGQALNPGTTPPSNCPATDRANDETNKSNNVIHNVQLQPSADGYKSALFRDSSVSHQAHELQHNTKVTTDTTKHVDCKDPDKPEDYFFDVFAEEDESDDSNTQPKQPKDSAISDHKSTLNAKISKQWNSQHSMKVPEPAPTTAAFQQLDSKGTLLPAHCS